MSTGDSDFFDDDLCDEFLPSSSSLQEQLHLNIETLTGEPLQITGDVNDTVHILKHRIAIANGIYVEKQYFFQNGLSSILGYLKLNANDGA